MSQLTAPAHKLDAPLPVRRALRVANAQAHWPHLPPLAGRLGFDQVQAQGHVQVHDQVHAHVYDRDRDHDHDHDCDRDRKVLLVRHSWIGNGLTTYRAPLR